MMGVKEKEERNDERGDNSASEESDKENIFRSRQVRRTTKKRATPYLGVGLRIRVYNLWHQFEEHNELLMNKSNTTPS